jgi:hypothetical protein
MISNGKKVNQVFQTKNYGMFKFRADNRVLNTTHIKKLSEKMKNIGWIPGSYVVINEKGEIIDGQHRVSAAQMVGVPISYTIERKSNFDTIRSLNQNQKNWSFTDYIHGYVKEDNVHYTLLDGFLNEFKDFKPTEALMFLQNNANPVHRDVFESGSWESKNVELGKDWAKKIQSLKPFFEKGYNKSIFVRAMIKLMSKKPDFVFEEFLHKVQLRPGMIHLCGSVELYTEMIEDIYNYRRRNTEKLNLRF